MKLCVIIGMNIRQKKRGRMRRKMEKNRKREREERSKVERISSNLLTLLLSFNSILSNSSKRATQNLSNDIINSQSLHVIWALVWFY
jgi:hypothetical protein